MDFNFGLTLIGDTMYAMAPWLVVHLSIDPHADTVLKQLYISSQSMPHSSQEHLVF